MCDIFALVELGGVVDPQKIWVLRKWIPLLVELNYMVFVVVVAISLG